jgi:hypothetical protein
LTPIGASSQTKTRARGPELAAHRLGELNEYAVLEAWVAGSIGTFVDSPTKILPSVNPSFRLRGSK